MKKLLLICLIPMLATAQNFWTEVSPFAASSNLSPSGISIVNANTICVKSNAQTALQQDQISITNDGGLSWISHPITIGNNRAVAFYALSSSTVFAGAISADPNSPSNTLWKTDDAGSSWIQVAINVPENSFINSIHFFDSVHGLIICDPDGANNQFLIFTTSDSGLHWDAVTDTNLPSALDGEYGYPDLSQAKSSSFWFGTNNGRIYQTSNMGLNWTVMQTPVPDFEGQASFAFRSENEGLLITSNFDFFRTVNAGASYTPEFPSTGFRNHQTVFVNGTNNTYFSIGEASASINRGSSYSTDGGLTWIDLNNVDANPVIPQQVKFASGTVGFCIGYYQSETTNPVKRFFKLTDPLNRLLHTDSNELKTAIRVYPNPANDVVNISGKAVVSVVVTDLSGKKIVSQEILPSEKLSLASGDWQKGVYIAKVSTQNGASQTFKIVKN